MYCRYSLSSYLTNSPNRLVPGEIPTQILVPARRAVILGDILNHRHVANGSDPDLDVRRWFATDALLAKTLERILLYGLQAFQWENSLPIYWADLLFKLQASLVKMFRSSSLTTLALSFLVRFSVSLLDTAPAVKNLELSHIVLQTWGRGELVLPQLESLTMIGDNHDQVLSGMSASQSLDFIQLVAPNLRTISIIEDYQELYFDPFAFARQIDSNSSRTCASSFRAFAQQAINASARSLEQLWWSYDSTSGT
jgi:hypothetical protein